MKEITIYKMIEGLFEFSSALIATTMIIFI